MNSISVYFKSLNKVNNGYLKIISTIDSIIIPDQLQCISNMIDNWVNLMDTYCNDVYYDKKNKHRKKYADKLADICEILFNDIKQRYQEKIESITPKEYTGLCDTTRIKGLNEISTEYYG